MSFNKEQLEAIAASSNENILISAGAGSGKTKTLSERVFRLISSGEVKPSELLVLTFTNNAAYEMKTRIIQNFKDNGKEDLAKQMVSAHIQTFDSFNQSLLRAYAGRLGIAANIQVADEALIEAKKRNILKDEILSVRYENDKERERLAETIVKFSLTDDRAFMDLVLKLQEAFEKLPSAQEEDIRAHYEERFFSHDAFVSWVYDYFDQARPVIEKAVKEAYFLERHPELEEASAEQLTHVFSNPNNFNLNLGSASFEHPKVQDLASRLIALLSLPKESKKEFFEGLRVIYNDKDAYNKNKGMPRKGYVRKVFEPMSDLFVEKKSSVGAALKNFGIADIEARYQEWMSFAPSILLFLELTKELSDKLMQYKKSNNAYTYQDIARLSLTLLTDPKFAEEAMDIRERFTYIMIDEYQDTNDFQEAFIESLLMPKRDGSMSHVFCVGDAKQSIYRFRNSKVELFRARQKAYLDGSKEGRVIAMNKNYRSGHGLLDDINHIFSYYMNVPHGGIDYHDSMERLSYEEPGAYPAPLSDFGVYRIVSTSRRGHDRFRYRGRLSTKEYCVDWEIQAIIADIKKKMAEGFLVYDRTIEEGDKRRPCRLSDFCVLMRNRTNFPKYLESFEEAGIEVNVSINSALRENEPIILIESLLRLIYRHIDGMSDVKHYFASVARSYVYQYDDEKLDHLIREDDADHTPKYLSDPIMQQVDAFAEAHRESDFNDLFLDLLNEFNVISALPRLGAVAESAAKIESLYARVRLHSSLGGNGMDFLAFLSELNTYQIELEDESLVKVDDAVDIMTIHGSKGLERKIVYFPCSSNSIGMRDRLTEFQLSAKYGLVFPDETYGGIGNALPLNCLGYPLETTMNGKPKREDVDELVRLYYVALTRAENQFIIVGDPSPRRSDNFTYERPYGMLFQLPKYEIFFEDFLKASIDRGFFTQGEVERYKKASKDLLTYLPLERSSFDDETYAFYEMIAEKHWRGHLEGDLQAQYESLCTKALDQYLIAFKEKAEDIDALSAVFGFSEYGLSVHDSHEFTEKIVEAMNAQANLRRRLRSDAGESRALLARQIHQGLRCAFRQRTEVERRHRESAYRLRPLLRWR